MTIKTNLKDSILTVTLNRPDSLNAFNPQLMDDLTDAFLDAGNSYRFLTFIKNLSLSNEIQVLVISHKHKIFRNAESLVGATFTPKLLTSQCFSVDLRKNEDQP